MSNPKLHPYLLEAIAFTAMAHVLFPGFSDKTERVLVPSHTTEWLSPILPEMPMQALEYSDTPPVTVPRMKYEVIDLGFHEWQTKRDNRQRAIHYVVRWGYGPETDRLVFSNLDVLVSNLEVMTWAQLFDQVDITPPT